MASTQSLFSPFELGSIRLPNRIVMAPMTRSRAGQGLAPTALNARYYEQRASAGLIITEGSQVSPRGQGYVNTPGIYTDEQVRGWRLVTDAVHRQSGRIFLQLWHVGRVSHRLFQPNGDAPVAPSAVTAPGETYTPEGRLPFSEPRALRQGEIPEIVEQFAEGARRAKAAGFDGVELHGANGYLIDQFLRDGTNRRSDAYGGSVENRARFLLEVVEAVTGVWSSDRVGVRISPLSTYAGMGDSDPFGTFSYVAKALDGRGLAYLHVVEPAGRNEDEARGRITPSLRERFRGPLMVNGGYTLESAESAVAKGHADVVSFGAPFIANPDLPERFRRGLLLATPDRATFYTGGERGYVDYPPASSLPVSAVI